MGATTFGVLAKGTNAQAAFAAAVKDAQHESGHGGYTGTIAEKTAFVIVSDGPMEAAAAGALAGTLIDNGDPRVDDKWGPAGAIEIKNGTWLFFGWASE
jgi:hypothetical protein